jgi:hypothetical protein
MEAALNELLHWIQAHPNWTGLFVLLVAALESFLVIGLQAASSCSASAP